MSSIAIGRLLRSNTSACVIGCRINQQNAPLFGEMLRIPLSNGLQIYGLVHEINIDDDGLVRQLVTAPEVSREVIEDNRQNRNMPVEMSVVFIGWERDGAVSHTRVPTPPLSLDEIFPCTNSEIVHFLEGGKFSYLRALLRNHRAARGRPAHCAFAAGSPRAAGHRRQLDRALPARGGLPAQR